MDSEDLFTDDDVIDASRDEPAEEAEQACETGVVLATVSGRALGTALSDAQVRARKLESIGRTKGFGAAPSWISCSAILI